MTVLEIVLPLLMVAAILASFMLVGALLARKGQ